jgi:hypothetical protein
LAHFIIAVTLPSCCAVRFGLVVGLLGAASLPCGRLAAANLRLQLRRFDIKAKLQ